MRQYCPAGDIPETRAILVTGDEQALVRAELSTPGSSGVGRQLAPFTGSQLRQVKKAANPLSSNLACLEQGVIAPITGQTPAIGAEFKCAAAQRVNQRLPGRQIPKPKRAVP